MKKLHTFITLVLFSFISFAQVPQGISYQAVAFTTGGSPVVSGSVGVKISILDNSVSGTVIYEETHSATTNAQGLFNLNIGQGTPSIGIFSAINWALNSKFLKVEVDPTGGTNYTVVGTNQLMSVPYALYAESTNNSGVASATNYAGAKDGVVAVIYTNTNAYGFGHNSAGNPDWYGETLSGNVLGAIATDSAIVVYTNTTAYGFAHNSAGNIDWLSESISGTPLGATASGNSIVVYTSTNAYGFTPSNSAGNLDWLSESISGTPIGVSSNGKNCVVIYTSTNAYGFTNSNSAGNPNWLSESLSGTPIGATSSGDLIIVYTSTNAYGFTRNSVGNPDWLSETISGTIVGTAP